MRRRRRRKVLYIQELNPSLIEECDAIISLQESK
jgi:hypothetical protein